MTSRIVSLRPSLVGSPGGHRARLSKTPVIRIIPKMMPTDSLMSSTKSLEVIAMSSTSPICDTMRTLGHNRSTVEFAIRTVVINHVVQIRVNTNTSHAIWPGA